MTCLRIKNTMQVNKDLVDAVISNIRDGSVRLNMRHVLKIDGMDGKFTACIGGIAILAGAPSKAAEYHKGEGAVALNFSKELLGLDDVAAFELFINYPPDLAILASDKVIRVLEHLRDTDIVDWNKAEEIPDPFDLKPFY